MDEEEDLVPYYVGLAIGFFIGVLLTTVLVLLLRP